MPENPKRAETQPFARDPSPIELPNCNNRVKHCWIVQANWKVSQHWDVRPDADLEERYVEMKRRFDSEGSVFTQETAAQFLKQGEIDVVGVTQQGEVHAMEVAFHKERLHYSDGGRDTSIDNVIKKMLRTFFILRTYHSRATPIHIYFLSPKASPGIQVALETKIAALQEEYDEVDSVKWRLLTNNEFAKSIVEPVLANASGADTSELFVRSTKLLIAAGYRLEPPDTDPPTRPGAHRPEDVKPLVRALMQTLLVDHSSLLSDDEKADLTNNEYCKQKLGLRINFGLIRKIECGKEVKGHPRYWGDAYGDFYVCSQWSRSHCVNAESLLAFVEDLIQRSPEHQDTLRPHAQAFHEYLVRNRSSPLP